MKRRCARGEAGLSTLAKSLAALVDAIIGDECERDADLRRRIEERSLSPAEATRQALACALRIAYRLVESRESENGDQSVDSPFPSRSSTAPDLQGLDYGNDRRTPTTERLAEVLDGLSPDDLDQDALGEALSKLSTTPFARHPAVRGHEEKRARDSGGVFFTPNPIVARLLDATLEPLLDEVCEGKNAAEREAALLNLSVVDPACGSGRFLLVAVRRIAARLAQVRKDRGDASADEAAARVDVIERCLYGVDVDPLAIEALRFRLRREARKAGRTLTTIADRTICGDAFSEIDWHDLPGSGGVREGGFDLIVGNPPWTSYSGRHRGRAESKTIERLATRFPEITRWPALHSAMLALAGRIVRDGGRVGMVLPLRMADLDAYADLRAGIADRLRLAAPVIDAGESVFDQVTQPTGLFAFRADTGQAHGKPDPWPIERRETTCRSATSRADDRRVEEALEELDRLPKFPPRTFGDPGVHTGNAAAKLIADGQARGGEASIREGRDVLAFACLPARCTLRVSAALAPGEYCRVGPFERYSETPILLRQTADRPIAARHVERTYFRNSVLACRGVEGASDLAFVAFLNSALYALLHRRSSGDAKQRSFPQVKVRALHNLPIPPIRGGESSSADARLIGDIEQAASLAEAAAYQGQAPDAELLERLERFVLHAFGVPEELAPLLLERANGKRPDRVCQFK